MNENELWDRIPDKVKSRYGMEISRGDLVLQEPEFIAVKMDSVEGVKDNGTTLCFNGDGFCLTVWLDTTITHTSMR